MSEILVRNLVKTFGETNVIDDVTFTVPRGEILVILGASGCGKTTTLRCLAGLEKPTSGEIVIDGKPMFGRNIDVPPENRGLGMVFQSYALWPHKTVFGNVSYGLGNLSTEEKRSKVRDALALVGLSGTEDRFPSTLSGGQQQRIALARSAAARPKVMLLDEPLSNLDAKLRETMRSELRTLINELGMTAIYITHDQSEAMALADQVIFMRNGKIEQKASPREIYNRPRTRAVAEFIGSATFLDGRLLSSNGVGSEVDLGGFTLRSTSTLERAAERAVVAIRPERVKLSQDASGGGIIGKVRSQVFLGEATEYEIEVHGIQLVSKSRVELSAGQPVGVSIAPDDVILLPA
ncbi:ABC transporter ATP-binding protein [Frigidibacter sp. MR17.14]|uniref:ABC transporter ATP-binding protein n=1 Tax=Frigidibacter sp. MR17.14 TaxID=3126509 RepID=UPI00301300D2